MINIEREYRKLMYDILATGKDKSDRTGTGTKSVFGRTIQTRYERRISYVNI